MECKACGNTLQTLEFQSRSADEAHTSVYRCANCALDIDKFSNAIKRPHVYLPHIKRKTSRTPCTEIRQTKAYNILRVTSKDFQMAKSTPVYESVAFNVLDSDSNMFKSYTSGAWEGRSICKMSQRRIALNAVVEHVMISDSVDIVGTDYIDFRYSVMDDRMIVHNVNSVSMVALVEDGSDESILECLGEAYMAGFCPSSLNNYLDNVFLGSISNLHSRAYDVLKAEDNIHFFSSKPDGERMWLVKCGSTWLYCRRLLGFRIESFFIDSTLRPVDDLVVSLVIDVEVMWGFPSILIDILVTPEGGRAPYDRTIPWIQETITSLVRTETYLQSVYVRPFFQTLSEAQLYVDSVQYPTDGIVAISASGTDMKKIKPIRSVELVLNEDMTLSTKNGTKYFRLNSNDSFEVGSIIEIRFSIVDSRINIESYFLRFDKKTPNDDEAMTSILESAITPKSENMTRNIVWRWSNKLRFYIYNFTNQFRPEKNIILDIGSGSGQSSEAFDKVPNCSFILVEPDEVRCKSLSQRLGVKSYDKNPRSIISVEPSLRKGMKKYHIVNCTLKDILSDHAIVSNIRNSIKCVVACFSSHYIMNEIETVVEIGIPFIGSFYSYTDVEVGESIIDEGRVHMTRTSNKGAIVRWGADQEYEEPVETDDDIPVSVESLNALQVIPLPTSGISDSVHRLCSHARVLISQ